MGTAAGVSRATPKRREVPVESVLNTAQKLLDLADTVVANPHLLTDEDAKARPQAFRAGRSKLLRVMLMLRERIDQFELVVSVDPHHPGTAVVVSAKTKPSATSTVSPARKAGSTSLEDLRRQAREGMRKLVQNGTLIKYSQFLQEWGHSKQALSQALAANRVFSLDVDGEPYYPAFYVDPHNDKKKLEKVSKALGDLPGASKLQFFLNGWGSLAGKTPLEALADGQITKVLSTAQGFVER